MARVTILSTLGEPSTQLTWHQTCESVSCQCGLSGRAPRDVMPERRVGKRHLGTPGAAEGSRALALSRKGERVMAESRAPGPLLFRGAR